MSNYYYRIKKRISKNYNLLGLGEKSFYYSLMFLFFISIYGFYDYVQTSTLDNQSTGYFYIILGFVSYGASKYYKTIIAKKRWEATKKMAADSLITLEALNSLIDELEKYLSSLKTISQWSVGVLTTLLVLISTLIGNGLFKFVDVFFNIIDDDVRKNLSELALKEYNNSAVNILDIISKITGNLFLLLALPVLIGYFSFSVLSFLKKQVLGILYDVRYHLLLKSSQIDYRYKRASKNVKYSLKKPNKNI